MIRHLSQRIVLAAVVSALGWAPWATGGDLPISPPATAGSSGLRHKPLVQLAILLDTSGSMSGLIDQARTELWSIVNQFIWARQKGVTPEVQVALFEYGNNGLPVQEKKAFIGAKSSERSEIQRQIQVLNQQRQQYIAGQRAKQETTGNTLGSAIVQAIRRQAADRRFEFVGVASGGEHP